MEYVQPVSLDMSQIQLVFVSFHVQSHAQPALTTSQQSAFPAMVMPALLMALVFSIPLAILILLVQTVDKDWVMSWLAHSVFSVTPSATVYNAA
jgi:hypothetical protein